MKTISRKLIEKGVRVLVKAGKQIDIRPFLENCGVTECVIKEWETEIGRRNAILTTPHVRRPISKIRRSDCRRIIFEKKLDGYSIGLHATKGWRAFRIAA